MQKYLPALAFFLLMGLIITTGPTAQVSPASAAIQHQATTGTSQDSGGGAGSVNWDHTVGAGSGRLLIVTTAIDSSGGAVVTAVTFDGNLLTRRAARNEGFTEQVQLWYMLDPPVGTFPVEVEYSGVHFGIEARATTYTGVSQNRPISDAAVNGNTGSGPASVTVSSAPGELVIDALGFQNGAAIAAVAPQTERYNQSDSFNGGAASDRPGAAPNVTMSWTLGASDTWALAAASLRPAPDPIPAVRTVTVKPSGGDYASLNAALAGEAADLVALNLQLNIELYAMTDTEAVDLATPVYTTDPDHFIKIYTPLSQRHAGVWDPAKYNLELETKLVPAVSTTFPACISIGEVDVWLDGIQALCSSPVSDEFPSMIAAAPGSAGSATLRISNSIFKGDWMVSNAAKNANFITTYDWPATAEMWVWNTIATDFWWADQSRGRGLHTFGVQGGEIWWSNVTLANLSNVVSLGSSTRLHVRNSLAQLPGGGTSWPSSEPAIQSDSDYNASNQAETLAGSNSLSGQTFAFRGPDDWRLAASDTGAMDSGVNSYNSYQINNGRDLSGILRDAIWDIGASEYSDPGAPPADGGNGAGSGGGCFIALVMDW